MMRRGIIVLLLIGLVSAILLGVYLLSNARLELQGSSLEDGALKLETQLPQATCSKVLSRTFPFVKLTCEPKSEPENPEPESPVPDSESLE